MRLARSKEKARNFWVVYKRNYEYIRDKGEPEYKDGVELAEIVSSMREIMKKRRFYPTSVYCSLRVAFVSVLIGDG